MYATSAQANLISVGNTDIVIQGGIDSAYALTGYVGWTDPAAPTTLAWENCWSGVFRINVNNPSGDPRTGVIHTFCTDVGANWTSPRTYDAVAFGSALGVRPEWSASPASIENASWIYNKLFIPEFKAGTMTQKEGSALQLAIWKALYESNADGRLNTASFAEGVLQATGFGDSMGRAGEILAQLTAARNQNDFTKYVDTWLQPQTSDTQGLIYNPTTPVPEPATFIAGALLLLPFGASAWRIVRRTRAA